MTLTRSHLALSTCRGACIAVLLLAGCAEAVSGDDDGQQGNTDSGVTAADAAGIRPDASPGSPDASIGTPDAAPIPQSITLQAGAENTVLAANSIACSQGGFHLDNRYYRTYVLMDEGITTDFAVSGVDVGIQTAESTAATQPVEVALHTLAGALTLANLTQVATVTVDVSPQAASVLNVPISGLIPAGSTLVVEVHTPDGVAAGNAFFIGSNEAAEDTPSFLVGADCANPEPTASGALGVTGLIMSIVLNVTGEHTSP